MWSLKQIKDCLYYKVLAELPYDSLEDSGISDDLIQIRMKVSRPKLSKGKQSKLYPDKYYDDLLCKYFQLDTNLEEQCNNWMESHDHFKEIAKDKATAIRQLDQDPVENLFSFICSQNNHINRISTLVNKLGSLYGKHIADIDGVSYFNFPSVEKLADPGVEKTLRDNGFGYRAKFINKSAQEICSMGGLEYFSKLRSLSYREAHTELMKLTGIGPKVSDCICLMSLGHLSAIPVDTHILKIAQKHYTKDLTAGKSLTTAIYNKIGDTFREVYGPMAGWAQTILFCADLKQFQSETSTKKALKRKL